MPTFRKVIKTDIEFATMEGLNIFKLFANAYNSCNLDIVAVQRLIRRSDQFQNGIKKLIAELTVPTDFS